MQGQQAQQHQYYPMKVWARGRAVFGNLAASGCRWFYNPEALGSVSGVPGAELGGQRRLDLGAERMLGCTVQGSKMPQTKLRKPKVDGTCGLDRRVAGIESMHSLELKKAGGADGNPSSDTAFPSARFLATVQGLLQL